jgi:hypothetical protein
VSTVLFWRLLRIPNEEYPALSLVRLASFVIILLAIVDKNRAHGRK